MRTLRTVPALLAAVLCLSLAAAPAARADEKTARPKEFDYTAYNALLKDFVRGGRVDYAALKKTGSPSLGTVVSAMEQYPYDKILGHEPKLAFLINAYNAFVLQSVAAAYPVKSVKEIPGFFDQTKHTLATGSYTLDQIEKELIHARFADFPNYHFAIVCGGMGCPPLRSNAYAGDSLAAQMADQFNRYTLDRTRVSYDTDKNVMSVIELFKWYAADFEKGDQTIPRLLAPQFGLGQAMKIMKQEPKVEYTPFDWNLNDAGSGPPK